MLVETSLGLDFIFQFNVKSLNNTLLIFTLTFTPQDNKPNSLETSLDINNKNPNPLDVLSKVCLEFRCLKG